MPVNISGNGLFTGASSINGLTLPTDSFSPGLVKITDSTFSAVSAVNINNCFSATYDNYTMVLNNVSFDSGVNRALYLRLRASSTDASGATDYVTNQLFQYAASTSGAVGTTTSYISLGDASNTTITLGLRANIFNPRINTFTQFEFSAHRYQDNVANYTLLIGAGSHKVAYQADGFSLIVASGTFSGTVRVYGYRN